MATSLEQSASEGHHISNNREDFVKMVSVKRNR